MNRFVLSLATLSLLVGPVLAEDIQLATLGREGAEIPGDRMTVVRTYGSWTLRCDLSVSQNRRLCAVEQVLERPGGAVVWRLAHAADERNVLVWSLPRSMNPNRGLTLKLDGFSTAVTGWTCGTACLAVMPLSPPLQSLLLSAAAVEMSYVTTEGAPMVLSGTMEGFRIALRDAAEDPFGKRVPPPAQKSTAKQDGEHSSAKAKVVR